MAQTAAEESQGFLKGACEICYVGTGKGVPLHEGATYRGAGNSCYVSCRAYECKKLGACHWARVFPRRVIRFSRNRLCVYLLSFWVFVKLFCSAPLMGGRCSQELRLPRW